MKSFLMERERAFMGNAFRCSLVNQLYSGVEDLRHVIKKEEDLSGINKDDVIQLQGSMPHTHPDIISRTA